MFKSSLAQLAERTTVNRDVSGSIPLGRANVCNSVVECRDFLTRSSLVRSQSYVKNYLKILRSLMARICGFHPQDPGSIPGVDECPGMTLKAFQRMYPRGLRARSYRTDVSLVRIQSCVIRGMAQRKRAWLITTRSQDRNLLPR